MKTIIAGSRSITSKELLDAAMQKVPWKITEVVSGNAKGVDSLGESWAAQRGITVRVFPANWSQYGRAAGHIRNEEMAQYADACVVLWDGKSPGSKSMVKKAKYNKLLLHVEVCEIE